MCKTIDSDQLQELFVLIETLLQLPERYVAIRLQTTELFNAIAYLLSKQEANKRLVPEILKYTLRGFLDQRLTLPSSAYLFHILCKENASVIAPFAFEITQQIMTQNFVEKWTTSDKYADILRGFGLLVPPVCRGNLQ